MFIELVDVLRCLNEHEDAWLVAAVERFEGRHIDRGSLGCPVCRAEYPIVRGAADFRGPRAPVSTTASSAGTIPWSGDLADEAMRARALLDLRDHGGTIVLTGASAILAPVLEDETDVNVLLINPGPSFEQRAGRSTLLVGERVPLARASVRGALVAEDEVSASILAGLASALREGGRLVAPASAPLPGALEELARDERHWVAVRTGAPSDLVTLGARR